MDDEIWDWVLRQKQAIDRERADLAEVSRRAS